MILRRLLLVAVTGILFFASLGGEAWAGAEFLGIGTERAKAESLGIGTERAGAQSAGIGEAAPGVVVDGKPVEFNEKSGFPYLSDTGSTMLPVRACLGAIGCEVSWDDETKTVITWKGNTKVTIPVGKNEIDLNGKKVNTSAPAVIKADRVYLPLRTVFEAYGYQVSWDSKTRLVTANSYSNQNLTPLNINGGTTGIFSRKQLGFNGFTGIQAEVTLPKVSLAEKGDCPYVYFGFDWEGDGGNAEGGFQFIEDPSHPGYNRWTVFLRQGSEWRWGQNILLEQGSTHRIRFYSECVSSEQVDLVIDLDGREVVRKPSAVMDFSSTSAKAVIAMAMSNPFDGTNCFSQSEGAKIRALQVTKGWNTDSAASIETNANDNKYQDFDTYPLYHLWRPEVGAFGMHYGTVDCIPSYLHQEADGSISIYKD
ncbi:copper amine oxidase N-terminal domain-containing protein [Anoxybacterium hadale]|uniref:copper amine oxidase N-terminal domain-containing protein n=1 Tax=Anoxybacterium hadale TaxID=3408580 RepID=UPI003AFFE2EC